MVEARMPIVIAAVALGGAVGSVARWLVEVIAAPTFGDLPWATFFVNLVGCLLMGVLVARVINNPRAHPLSRPFLGTGVLGGFTTFSAYAVDAVALTRDGAPIIAAIYVIGTVLACLLAVWLGVRIGRMPPGRMPSGRVQST